MNLSHIHLAVQSATPKEQALVIRQIIAFGDISDFLVWGSEGWKLHWRPQPLKQAASQPRSLAHGPQQQHDKWWQVRKWVSSDNKEPPRSKQRDNGTTICLLRARRSPEPSHTAYKNFIMSNKFGGIFVNGNKFNWIIGTHGNWKNQKPGGRFGATS